MGREVELDEWRRCLYENKTNIFSIRANEGRKEGGAVVSSQRRRWQRVAVPSAQIKAVPGLIIVINNK